MTKVAVYGFVRIAFDLLGQPAWWLGLIVLAVAGVTTVLGVLYALMQHDLKRLLAYHTVENIGIIFIGLGLALAFRANGIDWASALALTAALFHVLNHSIFKSLLFFGAGAVLTATGQRDMERLGGLIHTMPWTAVVFLIGCAAISALPPLNGFVSEWLTFQAILVSPQLPQWGLKLMIPAAGALLALSAALAAACFVKAFGITFLGRPRTPAAEAAKEVDGFSLAAMFVLAAALRPRGHHAGHRHRPARSGGQRPRRYADAAVRGALAVDRTHQRRTQLLQRIADPDFSGDRGHVDRHVRSSLRDPRDAAQRDLGLRLPRPLGRDAIHRLELRHADPPRVRHDRLPGSRAGRHAETGRDPSRGISKSRFSIRPGASPMDRSRVPSCVVAARLNHLQFLTIRRYLTLTVATLVVLLLVVAAWR